MTRMRVKKTISLLVGVEFFILISYLYSFEVYINIQVASLSSFVVIMGSMYAYHKMVHKQVQTEEYEEQKDILDTIENPHELYDEMPINNIPVEELDFKAIVQEEKKKIKIVSLKEMKKGSSAGFSLFRLVPYLFLVLGFIALKNNNLLHITVYLPSLLVGIISGYISSKLLFK